MNIKQAAEYLGWTELFTREAIAQGKVDFGICVTLPQSRRRTFKINEERLKKWKNGTI